MKSATWLGFGVQRLVANVTLSFCLPIPIIYILKALQNPLPGVAFVTSSALVFAEDRKEGKTQTKCKSSGWRPQRWVRGSGDKERDEFKE